MFTRNKVGGLLVPGQVEARLFPLIVKVWSGFA